MRNVTILTLSLHHFLDLLFANADFSCPTVNNNKKKVHAEIMMNEF
jgi:hypothetical protein